MRDSSSDDREIESIQLGKEAEWSILQPKLLTVPIFNLVAISFLNKILVIGKYHAMPQFLTFTEEGELEQVVSGN